MESVIIMSGSFNPPTIAHYRTMLAAVEALEETIGAVPLKRWFADVAMAVRDLSEDQLRYRAFAEYFDEG